MNNKSSGFPDPPALNHYKLNQNYLPLFVDYLKYVADRTTSQGYTTIQKNTLRFLKYLQRRKLLPENLTGNDGVHYRNYLSTRKKKDGTPLSTGTVINRMKTGKALCEFLVDQGLCEANPFTGVPYPRLPEHLSRNLLNEAQMGNLLSRLEQFTRKKYQRERLRDYKVHVVSEGNSKVTDTKFAWCLECWTALNREQSQGRISQGRISLDNFKDLLYTVTIHDL